MGGTNEPERRDDRGADIAAAAPAAAADWAGVVDDLWWAGTDVDATLRRLAQRTSRVLQASSAVFVLRSDRLEPRAFWDDDPHRRAVIERVFDRGPVPADTGPMAEVLSQRKSVLVTDIAEPPDDSEPMHFRGYVAASRLHSSLIVPLLAHDEALGLLAIGRHADQPPIDAAVRATAERMATVVAHIARLATLVDHLRVADAALGAMTEAVIATDEVGCVTFWNHGAEQVYGRRAAEVLGQPIADVLRPRVADHAERRRQVRHALQRDEQWSGRAWHLRQDGSEVVVDSVVTRLRAGDGSNVGSVMVNRDRSAEEAISTQLHRQQALAQAALDSSPMLTAVMDAHGVVLAASRGWSQRIGGQHALGATVADIAGHLIPDERGRAHLVESFIAVVGDRVARTQGDFDVTTEDGDATFSVHITRVPDVGAAFTIADITDRASRERALSYSAGHDPVTQLPNRMALMDRGVHALSRASRNRTQVGLLFCDLDSFKDLNDRFGHGVGDDILEAFGQRLVQSCRASDTVARLGGDEFVILIEDSVDEETVAQVARRVVHAAEQPLGLADREITVTTSVGAVVVKPDPEEPVGEADVESAIGKADVAMYEAKRQGKHRWVMYDESIQQLETSRRVFLGDLGHTSGEFQLHFQPQFDHQDALRGAEALLRWQHPDRGVIEPSDVLHQAATLPAAVGDWVLGKVAATLSAWQGQLPSGFRMGVNLSHGQWLDRTTTDALLDWLDRVEVPRSLARVELPQDAVVVDLDHSAAVTRHLVDAGLDVAINGFGTGNAPMIALARLSVGTVVLSRRLIRDLGREPGALPLLRGIVAMCQGLGWQVIATGVEHPDQLQAVRDVGCHLAQGYLLGRAVPADRFRATYLPTSPLTLPD